jgi:hypothetical protein
MAKMVSPSVRAYTSEPPILSTNDRAMASPRPTLPLDQGSSIRVNVPLEHPRFDLGWHSGPVVDDLHNDEVTFRVGGYCDLLSPVFGRIRDGVSQHLPQSKTIRPDPRSDVVELDRDPAPAQWEQDRF